MSSVLRCLQVEDGSLVHVETRPPRDKTGQTVLEILLTVEIVKDRITQLAGRVRRADHVQASRMVGCKRATVQGENRGANIIIVSESGCWFPRHVSELDQCNHLLTKFEPELDMSHPGWSDQEYRARRKMIADVTFSYKSGDKIPRIEYTKEEIATWDAVYSKVFELLPGRASSMHRKYLAVMEAECGFGLGKIPQLEDVSNFLKSKEPY